VAPEEGSEAGEDDTPHIDLNTSASDQPTKKSPLTSRLRLFTPRHPNTRILRPIQPRHFNQYPSQILTWFVSPPLLMSSLCILALLPMGWVLFVAGIWSRASEAIIGGVLVMAHLACLPMRHVGRILLLLQNKQQGE